MPNETPEPPTGPEANVILVGKKPALIYAVATLSQLNQGGSEVRIRARGKAISHAIDVVEILKRRFLGDRLRVNEIKLDTETMPPREGFGPRNVSTIEIVLGKAD
jgi:DNA-binding protein